MSKQPTKNSAKSEGQKRGGNKPKIGDFFEVEISHGLFAYGRVLGNSIFAFYDSITKEKVTFDKLCEKKVLFKIWLMKYTWKKSNWKIIGTLPLEAEFLKPTWFAKQDPISGELTMYNSWNGIITEKKATRNQVKNLETAAVWDPDHVEERLLDHYFGRENKWVKSVALK